MKSLLRALAFSLIAATCALAHERTARAQDVTQLVYDDVKSVIEELLSREVAHSLVPQIACRAPDLRRMYPRTLQQIYDRHFGTLRTTLTEETNAVVAYQIYAHLVRTLETPSKQGTLLRYNVVAPAGIASSLEDKVFDKCLKTVKAELENKTPQVSPQEDIETICGSFPRTPAESFSCGVALAARAALDGDPSAAESRLLDAVSALIAQRVTLLVDILGSQAKPPRNFDQASRLATKALLMERFVVVIRQFLVAPDWAIPDASRLSAIVVSAAEEATTPGLTSTYVDAFKVVTDAMNRLRMQWRLLSSDGAEKVDIEEFATAIAASSGALLDLCTATSNVLKVGGDSCDIVRLKMQGLTAGNDLWPVVRAIARRDFRGLATIAMRDVFPEVPCEEKGAAKIDIAAASNVLSDVKPVPTTALVDCRKRSLFRTFAINTVAYIFDVESGEAGPGTREAFKQAATDVLIEIAEDTPSGFDRPPVSKIIYPDFALRYSWSDSYISDASSGRVRLTASVDWLTARIRLRYDQYTYLGLQFSLVDALGPFAELATRKREDYSYPAAPWLQFVRPRAEILFGLPALSRHLALTLGTSVRPSVACRQKDGSLTYTFVGYYTCDNDAADKVSQFFDFYIGLKFVL